MRAPQRKSSEISALLVIGFVKSTFGPILIFCVFLLHTKMQPQEHIFFICLYIDILYLSAMTLTHALTHITFCNVVFFYNLLLSVHKDLHCWFKCSMGERLNNVIFIAHFK